MIRKKEVRLKTNISHPNCPLEWWFFNGYYESSPKNRHYFMASFFRYSVKIEEKSSKNAHLLLLSVLNANSNQHHYISRIDPVLFESPLIKEESFRKFDLDQNVVDVFLSEIRDGRVPRNIQLEREKVKELGQTFGLEWADFSFRWDEDHFFLSFLEPGSKRHCELKLIPAKSSIEIDASQTMDYDNSSMFYVTISDLDLTGQVDGRSVVGKAWFDHQWGESSWYFLNEDQRKVIGWDWLGINLNNGTDFIAINIWDVKSGSVLKRSITGHPNEGEVVSSDTLVMTPMRFWESPHTHIRYPVEWKIEDPGLELELTFIPLADDQEIPIFGSMRAIWEGAGSISGFLGGRIVSGSARGEFQGYGYIFDINDFFKQAAERVDRRIRDFFPKELGKNDIRRYVGQTHWEYEPSAFTRILSEPVWDLIERGGKRWRPLFTLYFLDSLGKNPEPYEELICAIAELSHTGSLIIDDIEDSSLIRRGKDCIHHRFGQNVAINAANTLYFLPILLLIDHPFLSEKQRLEIHGLIIKQYIRAHFGQGLDLSWTQEMNPHSLQSWMNDSMGPKILQMYEFKTAAPLMGLSHLAAIIAEADDNLTSQCVQFARNFGVAFQILDDVQNFSSSSEWKKVCGEDLFNGKLTYVIYRALKLLSSVDKDRLAQIMCSEKLRKNSSSLQEGIELVRKSGALQACQVEGEKMMETHLDWLSKSLPFSESKLSLQVLCRHLLNMNFEY